MLNLIDFTIKQILNSIYFNYFELLYETDDKKLDLFLHLNFFLSSIICLISSCCLISLSDNSITF